MRKRWWRIEANSINSAPIQRLSATEFKRKFLARLDGEDNEFTPFVSAPRFGRPSIENWAALRRHVFARDDFTCTYCGQRGARLECDHVMPLARGGSNEIENLTTACRPCNRSKRAKTLEEWRPDHAAHQNH